MTEQLMTVQEANQSLAAVIASHLTLVQSGKCGTPTTDDLQLCGKLHSIVGELTKKG